MVCVDPHDIPVVAFVDPDMMATMPKGLTAATGMDALTHAIEGYTTKGAWALPDCLNLEAIRLIARSLRGAVQNDPDGREGMALGQFVTGMDQAAYRKAAVDAVRQLSVDVGIPTKLDKIKEEDLEFLAQSAFADACAPGNPKEASVEDLKALIRKLM